jgi:DNA-binding NarL/FixJ family response regulator
MQIALPSAANCTMQSAVNNAVRSNLQKTIGTLLAAKISMKHISILLTEDHAFVREGLRNMLEFEEDLKVVGEAEDGRQAVEMVKQLRPSVVLMDISMPNLNGLEATRQILKAVPATKVLMLSAHGEDAYIASAMESGAAGYVLKQTSADDIYRAIRSVHEGKTFFSPSVSWRLNQADSQPSDQGGMSHPKSADLTSREMEVLQLVAEGKANKETAAELGISMKTVEKHRDHLMKKLNIHDTANLTRYAISAGIIESSGLLTTV